MSGRAGFVRMCQLRLDREQSLDDHVLNRGFELLNIVTSVFQVLYDRMKVYILTS